MSFLYPTFLFALFALLIPIIIHLFNFRRYKKVLFTNVKFLKEIQEETSSRSKLKHLLVLLARLLALAALIFAFAQPFIPNRLASQKNVQKSVSIYIDNSFSMDAKSDELSLLDQAKDKATDIIKAYNDETEFQILTNDFEGKMQRLVTKDIALARVAEIQISPKSKKSDEVLSRQEQALEVESNAQKEFYYISDFQKNTFDKITDTLHSIHLLPLLATNTNNVYIDSVWLSSPAQAIGEQLTVMIRLKNTADEEATRQVVLKINDQVKGNITMTMPAQGMVVDTLSFSLSEKGWQKGELSIEDFPITFDDSYYFSFDVNEQMKVLILDQGSGNKYLNTVFLSDNKFSWKNANVNSIELDHIAENNIIILSNINTIREDLAEALRTYVNQGGTLFIFPGENIDKIVLNNFLQTLNCDQLSTWNTVADEVSSINTNEEEYKDVFVKIDENLDLPKVYKYYTFVGGFTNKIELLRMKNGQGLINKYKVGNGKVYLSASPCLETTTSLPLNAVFIPLIYRTGLLSQAFVQSHFTIGQDNHIEVSNVSTKGDTDFRLKGTQQELIPEQRNENGNLILTLGTLINQAGFYELINSENKVESIFAFNYNRAESDLQFMSIEDLKNAITSKNVQIIENPHANIQDIARSISDGKRLWKYFIIAALLFLLLEIILLRFWK